jgi:hypothetical protein
MILSDSCCQKGLDRFGEVTYAELCVRGRLKSTVVRGFDTWTMSCDIGTLLLDSLELRERQVPTTGGELVFQRIGVLYGEDRGGNEWFEECPQRELKLI